MALNLYIMRYNHLGEGCCDIYDEILVAAASESDARSIHPVAEWSECTKEDLLQWAPTPEDVTVHCIGTAGDGIERGILMYNYYGC